MSPLMHIEPGIKIAMQASPEPTEDDLAFIQQMGLEYVVLWTGADKASYEYYASRRALFEQAGLKVYGFGNRDVHNQDAIVLGLANRDAKIEEYKAHLRNLGKAGIPYTTYAHMANGIWSTEPELTRGGAVARAFDVEKAEQGHWNGVHYHMPLSHGRAYTEDEIWANYEYFIKRVVPVAATPMIPHYLNWVVCRAASSAVSKATGALWRSPIAQTSASACALVVGSKAVT